MDTVHSRLTRPRNGKVIAGVCAGFAQAYGWDVVLVRLALVATILLGCGMPFLLYLVAWFVMPKEPVMFAGGPTAGPSDPMGTQVAA